MTKRSVSVVMTVLLLSYLPILDQSSSYENSSEEGLALDSAVERIEISPDPNSIQNLGAPNIYSGYEDIRSVRADSTIGVYTGAGLLPGVAMSSKLAETRSDLAVVLVDGEAGLWDARQEILDAGEVEIRSTIPPSGFLVQGSPGQLAELTRISVGSAVHDVPAGLLVHPMFWEASGDEAILVEVLGWKDSELIRHSEPGLGLDDSLSIAASLWLEEAWSPEQGRIWGEIGISDIPQIVRHPSVAYVAPLPLLMLHNDEARDHMGINTVDNTFITGLNGSGQKIAVGDSGLDNDHGDFTGRVSGLTSVTPGDSSTADPSDGHGTHVACTVLGDGYRSSGTYQGIAPEALLYFQAMEDDDTGALYSYGINSMLNSAYNLSLIHI